MVARPAFLRTVEFRHGISNLDTARTQAIWPEGVGPYRGDGGDWGVRSEVFPDPVFPHFGVSMLLCEPHTTVYALDFAIVC